MNILHLQPISKKLIGKLLFPDQPSLTLVKIGLFRKTKVTGMLANSTQCFIYRFYNKLTAEAAFQVLHIFKHASELAFEKIWMNVGYSFPCSLNPDIAQLLQLHQ